MLILGLTGQSGAGKGYVSTLFAEHGIPSIDCDAVSREVCIPNAPCTLALAKEFGSDILSENGTLLRRELATRAFADEFATHRLNQITHPFILKALEEKIKKYAQNGCRALLLDAPTLFESRLDQRCDHIIAVTAPYSVRMERIRARDGLTEAQAQLRLHAQKEEAFYTSRADFIIVNEKTESCDDQVDHILKQLSLIQ